MQFFFAGLWNKICRRAEWPGTGFGLGSEGMFQNECAVVGLHRAWGNAVVLSAGLVLV